MKIKLNGTIWKLKPCRACAGTGLRIHRHDKRRVQLSCKTCRGFGITRKEKP